MPRAVHKHASLVDYVPSLSPRSCSCSHSLSSLRHLHYHHSRPIDRVLFDSDDSSDEYSVASDASSASWDWSSDDESIDHDNYHEDHDVHPINIYDGREYNNYYTMDRLQEFGFP